MAMEPDFGLDLLGLYATEAEGVVFVDEFDGNDRMEVAFGASFSDEGVCAAADCAGYDAKWEIAGERLGLDLSVHEL